jgi:hypothetical protein
MSPKQGLHTEYRIEYEEQDLARKYKTNVDIDGI